MKERLNTILLFIIIGLIVTGCSYAFYKYYNNKKEDEIVLLPKEDVIVEENKLSTSDFYVEVKGAVNNPGVYLVSNDNIINDLVSMAGGFTKNAYTNNINLSKTLKKQMVVYVYTKYEYNKKDEKKEETSLNCVCPSYDIKTCIDNNKSVIVSNDTDNKIDDNADVKEKLNENVPNDNIDLEVNNMQTTNDLININTASLEQLQTLSGIGEAKAKKIIEYRETISLFNSIDDIKNVSGISDSIFEKIKSYITIS